MDKAFQALDTSTHLCNSFGAAFKSSEISSTKALRKTTSRKNSIEGYLSQKQTLFSRPRQKIFDIIANWTER